MNTLAAFMLALAIFALGLAIGIESTPVVTVDHYKVIPIASAPCGEAPVAM